LEEAFTSTKDPREAPALLSRIERFAQGCARFLNASTPRARGRWRQRCLAGLDDRVVGLEIGSDLLACGVLRARCGPHLDAPKAIGILEGVHP